jgi:hypothetical protein
MAIGTAKGISGLKAFPLLLDKAADCLMIAVNQSGAIWSLTTFVPSRTIGPREVCFSVSLVEHLKSCHYFGFSYRGGLDLQG